MNSILVQFRAYLLLLDKLGWNQWPCWRGRVCSLHLRPNLEWSATAMTRHDPSRAILLSNWSLIC